MELIIMNAGSVKYIIVEIQSSSLTLKTAAEKTTSPSTEFHQDSRGATRWTQADTVLSTVYSSISLRFTLTTNQLFKLLWHLMISLQLSLGHFAAICVCVCLCVCGWVFGFAAWPDKKKLIRTGAVIWHIGKVPEHHMNQWTIIVLE